MLPKSLRETRPYLPCTGLAIGFALASATVDGDPTYTPWWGMGIAVAINLAGVVRISSRQRSRAHKASAPGQR